jgi:D-alanyl-D-alanine carboxypeptidase
MLKLSTALLALMAVPAAAQPLTPAEVTKVDELVAKTLADTGVPGVEIAIVRDGRIVLDKAYGKASDSVPTARPDLPFQIASNSKQFTAMAMLLLEDQGKLKLDDPVSKYVPGITEGNRITIRELLSHTSGLQDYWPQDYMFATMTHPITPEGIVDRWAKKPLDYEPGTRWQYSNTGYVVAGMIVEKASGEPWMQFLQEHIFRPLGMNPINQDDAIGPQYPQGYHRAALGPVRVATPPARGWLWSAGELSMTAGDLAKWDIARLRRSIAPADDWVAQETPVVRLDGTTNGYGLGVYNHYARERHVIDHGGEAVGFLSQNTVYPDSGAAIVVLTNADFSGATGTITAGIEKAVLAGPAAAQVNEAGREVDVRALYASLVNGKLDRAKLTQDLAYYFDPATLGDYRRSLAKLGTPKFESLGPPRLRGGFVNRNFTLHYPGGKDLALVTYAEAGAAGRWEQFMIMPE